MNILIKTSSCNGPYIHVNLEAIPLCYRWWQSKCYGCLLALQPLGNLTTTHNPTGRYFIVNGVWWGENSVPIHRNFLGWSVPRHYQTLWFCNIIIDINSISIATDCLYKNQAQGVSCIEISHRYCNSIRMGTIWTSKSWIFLQHQTIL